MTRGARVLLTTLSVRTSATTGKNYVAGWLGASKLLGWPGEPDKYGNKTIDLFLVGTEPKPAGTGIAVANGELDRRN
jgi:hypothetical protein